ncbi:RidA family protein [Sphaerisporangium album]|uniref:RidA family protein n=2 Tax=Sphaerisporangium album TaxID=509200 RepID=A0A367FNL9_9ACTN|nr:RidA family protein [Sphaerisporangium album]
MIRRWNPPGVAPPVAQYSHLVSVPAGHDLIMIAGQFGLLPDGTLAGPDAQTQSLQIYANIETLLRSAGAGPEHLVRLFTMLAGAEHLEGSRLARHQTFARWYPNGGYPTNSIAVLAGLSTPELTVQIDGMAAVPARVATELADGDLMHEIMEAV